jgi:AraC-like DNA-binding protein
MLGHFHEDYFRNKFQSFLDDFDYEGWNNFQVKKIVNTKEFPISEQAFYRQQISQGFKFKKIQADVRFNFAIKLMASEELTQSEVAKRVFYDSKVEFNKAFKNWSRKTPKQYIQNLSSM